LNFAQLDHTWGRLDGEPDPIVSVTEDRWRLIYQSSESESQLFDKQVDPGEQVNVASEEPEIVSALTEQVETYLGRDKPPWPDEAVSVEIDKMELHQLRALGYGVQ
jgi:hypothetical protein